MTVPSVTPKAAICALDKAPIWAVLKTAIWLPLNAPIWLVDKAPICVADSDPMALGVWTGGFELKSIPDVVLNPAICVLVSAWKDANDKFARTFAVKLKRLIDGICVGNKPPTCAALSLSVKFPTAAGEK